jgi:hypothetical protein
MENLRISVLGSLVLLAATVGCTSGPELENQPAAPEIGIIEIPGGTFELNHTELTASPAHLFYNYQQAAVSPDSAPLFVLTGGGPGAAMLFLLGFTGSYGIANPETTPSVAVNTNALTDLAHLLYVDARQAGLSWTELPDPSNELLRRAEFALQNYNVFVDAADVLSAVLAFLDAHPGLTGHQVYFVSESYGGARTTAMLSFLIDYLEYAADSRVFHSPDLDSRIARYMKEQLGGQPTQDEVAHRFAGQILLEPILAGARQNAAAGTLFEMPGSIIDQLAATAGVPYVRCSAQIGPCIPFDNAQMFLEHINRSRYDSRSDKTWLARHLAMATQIGTDPAALAAISGVTETRLGTMLARNGALAYRFGDPAYGASAVRGSSETTWGALEPWDAYFTSVNQEVLAAFYSQSARDQEIDPKGDIFGDLFLRNVRYVPTMVTRAEYDLEIYGPAVPLALESFPDVARVADLSASEELSVQYQDGTERRIFSPWYHESSHAVARDEGRKLHADIGTFLKRP